MVLLVNMRKTDDVSPAYRLIEEVLHDLAPGLLVRIMHFGKVSPAYLSEASPGALILGPQGTPWWEYSKEELDRFAGAVTGFPGPILGICGGHQFLAMAFGGTVGPISCPEHAKGYEGCDAERGLVSLDAQPAQAPLLDGLPPAIVVMENHYEEVKRVPPGFAVLASSPRSPAQIIVHEERPIYGVQFHPERADDNHPHGRRILENFLRLAGLLATPLPLVDLHCDQLMRLGRNPAGLGIAHSGPVSVEELRRGNYLAQVFAVFVEPGGKEEAVRRGRKLVAGFLDDLVGDSAGRLRQARAFEDLGANRDRGAISAILSIEGAHVLGDEASQLTWYAERGLRVLALTWNNSNAFADGPDEADPPPRGGLTEEGARLLALMEHHRIVADLSHAHPETFWDVVTAIRGPVLASHSNARGVCDHKRNLDDEQLLAIAQKQGLLGLCLHPPFVVPAGGRAGPEQLLAQYRYVRRIMGKGHLAFGADLGSRIRPVRPVTTAGDLQELLRELAALGLDQEELEALSHEDFVRFWERATRGYDQISPLDWRPIRVLGVAEPSSDFVLFDRLSSTGRRICSPAGQEWRFDTTMRLQDGPHEVALRLRASQRGPDGFSVGVVVAAGEATIGRRTCPADGSRCLVGLAKRTEQRAALTLSLSLTAGTKMGMCIEVLDVVPILRLSREGAPAQL
jgi:membrane dipeptidase